MSMRRIVTGDIEVPAGPYSPGVEADGWLFVSGQIGTENGRMREGVYEQAKQAIANIFKILDTAGASTDQLVKLTVFLRNIDDFEELNRAYRECFCECFFDEFPARSTLEAAGLPGGALVEIEAVAFVG